MKYKYLYVKGYHTKNNNTPIKYYKSWDNYWKLLLSNNVRVIRLERGSNMIDTQYIIDKYNVNIRGNWSIGFSDNIDGSLIVVNLRKGNII